VTRDDDDILRLALELQAKEETRQDQEEALRDLGVSQANLDRATQLVRAQAHVRQQTWKKRIGLIALILGALASWMLLALLTPTPSAVIAGVSLADGRARTQLSMAEARGPLEFYAEVQDLESDAVFGLHVDWLSPTGETLASCSDSRHHAREARLRFSCRVELSPPIPPGEWRVRVALQNKKLGRMPLSMHGVETPGELRLKISD
jgi:hypothetical protein